MKGIFLLATVLLFLFSTALTSSKMAGFNQPIAVHQTTAKPGAANHMIYDAQRRQMILLAAPRQAEREEVWGWDGKQWLFIPSTGPAVRELSAAAYARL